MVDAEVAQSVAPLLAAVNRAAEGVDSQGGFVFPSLQDVATACTHL
jgi:hypothetical protein